MFGSNNNSGGGFSFGGNTNQANNSQTNSGGSSLFGSNTNASTSNNLFGTSSNTNNSLFGSSNASNTGGGSSLFGGGSSTNQTSGGSSLFGNNSNSAFANNSGAQSNGTAQKFDPKLSQDTNPRGGSQQIRLLCYSAMTHAQTKSLEELRIEDYMANRKAGGQGNPSGGNLFASNTNTNTTGGSNLFGNSNSNSGFGNTNAAGSSLFGNNNAKSNTGGSLFGNTSATGNTTGNSGGSLFGNSSKTFGFGNSTTNTTTNNTGGLFGNTTNNAAGGSLFGNNNTTTSTGSLFGNNTSSTGFGTTGGSLFGNNTTNSNTGGGLFGNTNNAKPAGGSLFGNTTTNNASGGLFGNNTTNSNTGGGLFNNTQKTGGSLFGNNNTNNATGGGLFGNANKASTGGSSFSFGNTTTSTAGGGLFGNNNSASTGSLFNTQNKTGGGMFGNTTNTGGSLFSNTTNTNNTAQTAQPQPQINLDATLQQLISNPYGDSPLFRHAMVDKAKLQEQLQPVSPSAQKAALQPVYKVTTNPTRSVLKPQQKRPNNRSLFIGLEDDADTSLNNSQLRPKKSVKKLTVKVNTSRRGNDSVLFNKIKQDSNGSLPATPRSGRLPLNFETETGDYTTQGNGLDSFVQTPETGGLSHPIESTNLENMRRDFKDRLNDSSYLDSNRTTPVDLDHISVEAEPHPAGIKLSRPGYQTVPPMSEIPGLDGNGECWVKEFSITRRNYGRIFWPGRINIAGLDLDQIVEIKRKCVLVYSDEIEDQKPPQGEGLNQKAEVSLLYTYPRSKETQEVIKDPERLDIMGWPAKLERATEKIGGRFLDYDLTTGTWSFSVQHFSKYELADSDEECDETPVTKAPILPLPKLGVQMKHNQQNLLKSIIAEEHIGLGGNDGEQFPRKDDEEDEVEITTNVTRTAVADLPTANTLLGCQKIQDMKFSFFGQDEEMNNEPSFSHSTRQEKSQLQNTSLMFDPKRMSVFSPKPELRLANPFSSKLKETTINTSTIGDARIGTRRRTRVQLGPVPLTEQTWSRKVAALNKLNQKSSDSQKFRVGWDNNANYCHGGAPVKKIGSTDAGILSQARGRVAGFPANFRRGAVTETLTPGELNCQKQLIDCFINHAKKVDDGSAVFHLQTDPDKAQEFIANILEMSSSFIGAEDCSYNTIQHEIVSLIHALWIDLPHKENTSLQIRERKKLLSKWLEETVAKTIASVTDETSSATKRIRYLLSGNQVREAIAAAQKNGFFRLSLLIPLAGSDRVQQMLSQQLSEWRDTRLDTTIDEDLYMIYQILAGRHVDKKTEGEVNVLGDLDWRRAFGFFLWHCSTNEHDLTDAIDMYEEAFTSGTCAYPVPAKLQKRIPDGINDIFPSTDIFDILYMLLKLYKNSHEPMNKLLIPETAGTDAFDHRVSFLVFVLLRTLGYITDRNSEETLIRAYASELENCGLWQQASAISMMLTDKCDRERAVRGILKRNVKVAEKDFEFLLSTCQIDERWVYEVKALEAIRWKDWREALNYLINADLYNAAHKVLMEEIAARSLIDGDVEYLAHKLGRLSDLEENIENWETEGAVYFDFFTASTLIKRLENGSQNSDDDLTQLDELGQQLANLISRIGGLPSSKPIDCLARAELARGALHLWETRLFALNAAEGHHHDDNIEQLQKLVEAARMPEDYAMTVMLKGIQGVLMGNDNNQRTL